MAFKLIDTKKKRPDCVLVTVENSDILDAVTSAPKQVTIYYNPATGTEHLKKKVSQAFESLQEAKTASTLENEIKAAVESLNTATAKEV